MLKPRPEDVTFLQMFRKKSRPAGWWPKEIYSLGITDCRFVEPGTEAGDTVREAWSFFYRGFRESHYPHILCLTREPLVLILAGIYAAKGHGLATDDDQLRHRIEVLIRPTWGFVNGSDTYAIPAPGDSRVIWTGLNHKIYDKSKIPHAVKLLRTRVFSRLLKKDSRCFLKALGYS